MAKRKAPIAANGWPLYLRISTTGQTTINQRRELEDVAGRHGWDVVQVFSDNGISGAKGSKDRPCLDALLKSVARREFDMVAAWSVDRLGRSLQDLVEVLSDLHAKGVDLYLHQQGLDTSTPSGRACSKCWEYWPNSSGQLYASAYSRVSPAPRRKALRRAGRRSKPATPASTKPSGPR